MLSEICIHAPKKHLGESYIFLLADFKLNLDQTGFSTDREDSRTGIGQQTDKTQNKMKNKGNKS